MNPIMKKALTYYNFLAAKKKEDFIASVKCQLWSDKTELNHLEFTEIPPIPKFEKPKVIPLSAGIWNLVRQMLP